MERSMDIVAAIMRTITTSQNKFVPRSELVDGIKNQYKDATDIQIDYHVLILLESGLIAAPGAGGEYRLTWDGHDYFDGYREKLTRPLSIR
jgi:hypothetical protein